MMLSDVCLSVVYIGSKGQRSRSPDRFTHRGVNASGSCSGDRGNVLAMGTYCYVAVCTLQARSVRRREPLRRPRGEERSGGILWRPPAYSLLNLPLPWQQSVALFNELWEQKLINNFNYSLQQH